VAPWALSVIQSAPHLRTWIYVVSVAVGAFNGHTAMTGMGVIFGRRSVPQVDVFFAVNAFHVEPPAPF